MITSEPRPTQRQVEEDFLAKSIYEELEGKTNGEIGEYLSRNPTYTEFLRNYSPESNPVGRQSESERALIIMVRNHFLYD
jgi:hypothetical protein